MPLAVCIICCNEEVNIGRTLSSVYEIAEEVILVDWVRPTAPWK